MRQSSFKMARANATRHGCLAVLIAQLTTAAPYTSEPWQNVARKSFTVTCRTTMPLPSLPSSLPQIPPAFGSSCSKPEDAPPISGSKAMQSYARLCKLQVLLHLRAIATQTALHSEAKLGSGWGLVNFVNMNSSQFETMQGIP